MTFQVWLFWITGALLGGAGSFLICFGLFSDRLSGRFRRRHCAKCWYEMSKSSGLRCPECGHEARDEKEFITPRRRWGLASAGLLLALGSFSLNWYAAGLIVGWQNIAPIAILVRLSPIIGREQALRSVVPQGRGGLPTLAPVTTATVLTFRPTENLALSVLQDENATDREIFAAVDALHWMRDQITRDEDVIRALQDIVKHRSIPLYTWSDLYYGLIVRSKVPRNGREVLDSVRSSGSGTQAFASSLVQGGLTPMGAQIFPDLLASAQVSGITWREFEYVSPEIKAILLKRCREVYFAGDDLLKSQLSRFLWPNGSYMPAGNPDFEAMAREQIEQFRCGQETPAIASNSFILWQASEPLSGLIPEIAGLLSGVSAEGRTRARGILLNVKLPTPRQVALTEALCQVMRDGNDIGRSIAIDIVARRSEIDRDRIVEAVVQNIGQIIDPSVFKKLFLFATQASGESPNARSKNDRLADLEVVLFQNVSSDSPVAAVSAESIATLPSIRAETIAMLESVRIDPTKNRATRAAARDALLHIRDRSEPQVDPAAPWREHVDGTIPASGFTK